MKKKISSMFSSFIIFLYETYEVISVTTNVIVTKQKRIVFLPTLIVHLNEEMNLFTKFPDIDASK